MYKRSDAPDRLVVTYENQSNPIAFEEILPRGKFFDSGSDGCFDIFEDGEGSCICELIDFNDDIHMNDYTNVMYKNESNSGQSFNLKDEKNVDY